MKKALIFEKEVIQIEEQSFEVAKPLFWADCGDEVKTGWTYENGAFKEPENVNINSTPINSEKPDYHQRNSANPSKVTSVTGNIVDLSQSDNFTVSLNTAGMLTLTNPSVGQSGVLIVSGATNISGFSSNISFRIVPTGLNATETFAYFVQSEDVIKMGRV